MTPREFVIEVYIVNGFEYGTELEAAEAKDFALAGAELEEATATAVEVAEYDFETVH